MEYVALITARSGSKGVKDKNIKPLSGYPLIAWSVMACKKSNLIEEVYISTDSREYADIAENFGAKVPFLRPIELAQDNSTDLDVFSHALNFFETKSTPIKNYVHIRPTTPIRNPKLIDESIKFFETNFDSFDSLRSIHEMSESAYKSFELDEIGNLKLFGQNTNFESSNLPRQQFPKTYTANGYVDILKSENIKNKKTLHGRLIHGFITPVTSEIDIAEDFDFIEWQIKKNPDIVKQLFGDTQNG